MVNIPGKAAAYLSAMALATGCVDGYPEEARSSEAKTVSNFDQGFDLSQVEAQKTLCDRGNDTWAAVGKALTCEEMTAPHIKEIALKNANDFLGKLKGLIDTHNVTPIDSSIGSSEFKTHNYSIGDPNGDHHVLQIFDGQYEAIVYLYLNAKGDPQNGFASAESYSYSLSANSFDFYHFENGSGPIKSNPDLKVMNPDACASEINAAIYPDGVYVMDIVASAQDASGGYGLNCPALPNLTEKFNSICAESKSEGSATCAVAPDSQKTQIVDRRSPLIPNSSETDIYAQFLVLQDLANILGFDLQPFEK